MTVWEFDVGVTTHDLLRRGVLVDHYVLVRVAARSYLEASQLDGRLRRLRHRMPHPYLILERRNDAKSHV